MKAAELERELWAYWLALEAGRAPEARARYEAAVRQAQARGLVYRPVGELAEGPLEELVARLLRLQAKGELADPVAVTADLGGVERPPFMLTEALEVFLEETGDRRAGMSENQVRKWSAPRRRAVAAFLEVCGDKALDAITRDDALALRAWWRKRMEAGDAQTHTANKAIGHLSDVFKTVVELRGLGLANPFAALRLRGDPVRRRPGFATDWIRERILAPGALDGMNAEARDVLVMMINTGAGIAEITGTRPQDLALGANVPHLVIEAHEGRRLKTGHRGRSVPLLGVSLEAARRRAEAGGFPRYADAPDTLSATANKYLAERGLLPSPKHSLYSFRHAFQDRLIAAEVPERIQADLMGHKTARPRYGAGATLEQVAGWLEKVAL